MKITSVTNKGHLWTFQKFDYVTLIVEFNKRLLETYMLEFLEAVNGLDDSALKDLTSV